MANPSLYTRNSGIREAALFFCMMAPGLLWPAPPPTKKTQRNARIRVRLIRHELRSCLLAGGVTSWKLAPRLAHTNPSRTLPARTLTSSSLGRGGRRGKTWKQLQGMGVAEPSYATCDKVKEKWAPRKDELPMEPAPIGAPIARDTLRMIFASEKMNAAVAKLASGAALDACGWSREMVQALKRTSTVSIGWLRKL